MTVAVNPIQKDTTNEQLLLGALKVAGDVYGVKMTQKQQEATKKYEVDKKAEEEIKKAATELSKNQQDFDKNYLKLPAGQENSPGSQVLTRPGETQPGAYISLDLFKDREKNANEIKKAQIAANTKEGAKDKTITAQQASSLGDLNTVEGSILGLSSDWDKLASETGSSIGSLFKGSNANQYNLKKQAAIQSIGYALEGGKMTDGDREFYAGMMPTVADNAAQKKAKIDALIKYAREKKAGQIQSLRDAGYDVSGYKEKAAIANEGGIDFESLNQAFSNLPKDEQLEVNKALKEIQKRGLTGTAQQGR